MKTSDMFKKIYMEIKEEMTKNANEIFLKEYNIPSINYHSEEIEFEDPYFASGIEMEIDRILQNFDYKVFVSSYQDKYFFSNDEETVNKALIKYLDEKEEKSI